MWISCAKNSSRLVEERVDHYPYLFACYTVVWGGVVVYVIQLARRHRALRRELEELRQLMTREQRAPSRSATGS